MRWPSAYSLAMSATVRRRTVSVVALMLAPRAASDSSHQSARRRRARPARGDAVEQPFGDLALGLERQVLARAVGGEDRDAVRVGPEARARLGDVVGDEQVDALAPELLGGAVERPGLRREADEDRHGLERLARRRALAVEPRAIRAISARRSGVGSSSSVRPSPRSSLRSAGVAGRKSATAAAMTSASKPGAPSARVDGAQQRGAQVGGRLDADDRRRRAGSGTSTLAAISVTRAPRSSAASAIATPILPVERLPMNRTGIDRLARAARGDDDVAAREVGVAGRLDERRAGGRVGGADRAVADRRDDRVDDRGELRQPPDARLPRRERPALGLDDRVAEASRSRATFARVAGWVHMSPSIAGATTTGADVARHAAVTTSPAQPVRPSRPASAPSPGATTIASARVGDDDVADPAVGQQVEHVGLDRVARQRGERQRADERASPTASA